jgi:hypothetical protein
VSLHKTGSRKAMTILFATARKMAALDERLPLYFHVEQGFLQFYSFRETGGVQAVHN